MYDPLSGSYYSACEYMFIPIHLLSIVSDSDLDFRKDGLQQLVVVFSGKGIQDLSDSKRKDEMKNGIITFVPTGELIIAGKHMNDWDPPTLLEMQMFQP